MVVMVKTERHIQIKRIGNEINKGTIHIYRGKRQKEIISLAKAHGFIRVKQNSN